LDVVLRRRGDLTIDQIEKRLPDFDHPPSIDVAFESPLDTEQVLVSGFSDFTPSTAL
jgi:homogentisate 1,2-dioxygenase